MPKRTDIKSILIIGAGPIVIGQACEFDYSGSQACKALREEGYRVVLINSNPATIMTDPNMADATYIEPINKEIIEKVIAKERPDALLPTLGGQTALNNALELAKSKVLEKYNVEMIGVNIDSIEKAEDRNKFKSQMTKIGIPTPKSSTAKSLDEGFRISKEIGYPLVIRPSFTLGGTGGSIAYNKEEFALLAKRGLYESPVSEILIEESVVGWKEYELEVMRDKADNVVIICSIENFDAMGIHTGDSITVAPQQTLSDKEYQKLRNYSIKIIRAIGVDTGGSNIQFAINPKDGRVIVIEMNPRVSRSSALASKATGFPIAKIAAKLAVGYTLDELYNDITKKTKAAFEPTLDYCVVKIPRWSFEKFPNASNKLSIQMKSVGEVMAIGRTFKESFQKAIRSLENGKSGFVNKLFDKLKDYSEDEKKSLREELIPLLSFADPDRIFYIKDAFGIGFSKEEIYEYSKIDLWFLNQLKGLDEFETKLYKPLFNYTKELMREAKRKGFSDKQISDYTNSSEKEVRKYRKELGIIPTYKVVDTCAGEFESYTPYFYSCYEEEDEYLNTKIADKKVLIIGSGPNRIGQGVEFDYLCVQASYALREAGYGSIMVNSNPETVSTDYDTSDTLYFEPLTTEDILNIYEREKPQGVIVQLGGQTPLNLSNELEGYGINIFGTSTESIKETEDRNRFKGLLQKLKLLQPINDIAFSKDELLKKANTISYPLLIRPSYVLGGRAMEIVYSQEQLEGYTKQIIKEDIGFPILIDKFLQNAIELDIDAISDGYDTIICGIMEHIEEAGIHSGDSACILPPVNINEKCLKELKEQTHKIANALSVKGFINIQYALKEDKIYIIEANPRGSRTIPFVSKAKGVAWAKIACYVILGKRIKDLKIKKPKTNYIAVKEAVLPFNKFPEEDAILGPEMRSTGEVMGIDKHFGKAFAKSQISLNMNFPSHGNIFISVGKLMKERILDDIKKLYKLGFKIYATEGTKTYLATHNIPSEQTNKLDEGRPNLIDLLINDSINLIVNSPVSQKDVKDGQYIRKAAIKYNIPLITTARGFSALVSGIEKMKDEQLSVTPLQELFQ